MSSSKRNAKVKAGSSSTGGNGNREDKDSKDMTDTSAGPSTPNASTVGQQQNARARKQPKVEREVKIENDEMKVKVDDEWVSAIYLDEIRARVLEETKTHGAYDHPPAKGKHVLDVTAFHEEHKTWAEPRDKRPKVLFEFKKKGRKDPDDKVGTWIDNGKVVLGPDDVPIRDYQAITKLCSSQMEGFRMEVISRLDPRIRISDFRARMMKESVPGSNSLSMRKTRFRLRGRCLAWEHRAGSDFWEEKLSAEMTEGMVNANSTEQLQDLSMAEIERLQLETSGKNPERARGRALADDVRAQRLEAAKGKNTKKLELEAKFKEEIRDEDGSSFNTRPKGNNALTNGKRKRTTGVGAPDSDAFDEDYEEERALKKRQSPKHNVPITKKRKRTTGMGAQDSDDDFDEESLDVMAGKRHQEAEDCFDAMAKTRPAKKRRNSNSRDELPFDFHAEDPARSHLTRRRPRQTANMNQINDQSSSRLDDLIDPALSQGPGFEDDDDESILRGGTTISQSSDSNDTNSGEIEDSRDEIPRAQFEQDMVQDALAATRLDYEQITGLVAPATNPGENYLSQYGILQMHLNIVWRERNGVGDAPTLAGLEAWRQGNMRWNPSASTLREVQGQYGQPLYDGAENELRAARAQRGLRRAPRGRTQGRAGRSNDDTTNAFRSPAITATLPAYSTPNVTAEASSQAAAGEAPLFGEINAVNQSQVEAFQQWLEVHGRACYERRGAEHGDMLWEDYCLIWAITDWESSSRWSYPVYADNELPGPPLGADDSFFDDAARINVTSIEDLLYIDPQEPQGVVPRDLSVEDTVRPDQIGARELPQHFEEPAQQHESLPHDWSWLL